MTSPASRARSMLAVAVSCMPCTREIAWWVASCTVEIIALISVVADEVRGLAERTAVATVQIEKVIEGIQNETRATVGAMAEVSSQVDGGVALVDDATDSLHRIRSTAGEALERIREVAYATGEQSSASTEIARQVQTITEMADGTSGSMHSVVVAAEQLQGLAAELDALVGRFRC